MTYGKTIEMFLVDGTAEGIVTAELSNWNGKAIKVPRTSISDYVRDDIQNVGVYFLFCTDDEGENSVYVGESENVLTRLRQHLQDYKSGKEEYYWTTAVVFIGRDLNKALIRFLENRLVQIAEECNRLTVLTKTTYSTSLKESQRASMEEFIDNIKALMGALGYKVLTPMPKATSATDYLFCRGNGADAKGFVSSEGFTVLEGSSISDHVTESFKTHGHSYYELREKLISDQVIVQDVFTHDYEFNAPSAASAVVLGRTSNGKRDWKNAAGRVLGDL